VTRPTKTLVVLGTGQLGGAELAAITLVEHAPRDIQLEALVLAPGPAVAGLEALGVPVSVDAIVGRPSPQRAGRFHREFRRLLARSDPDIVLAVGVKAAFLCVAGARMARIPIVWQKVDFTYDGRFAGSLARICSGVVAVSDAVAAAVPDGRVLGVVPPPVRLPESYRAARNPSPRAIGSAGALVPYKGHAHLIEAAARLTESAPDLRVLIAGGPTLAAPGHERELHEAAERWDIAERVELLGHVDRIEHVLDRLSIFVSATHRDEKGFGHEGMGAAMLEASWAGLPVVATSGGGAPEAVRDGVTGTLVPPAEPGRLAEAIGRYLGDPAAAHAAGEAGARFAREHFRPERLGPRLFELLRESARRPGA
jgi:glycosyltransferase involved in cell wall biosynthesis